MDLSKIHAAIKRIIKKHNEAFKVIGGSQPKLLELASITGFAEHYKSHGFFVRVHNPKGKAYFAMKAGTHGDPWNFSHFSANDGIENVEIHMNVKVRSAHDSGTYCVDVGVVRAGAIPRDKPASKWECLPNEDLVTFGESKKLVVYPMLLAQFIGIVHEIKPGYLSYTSKKATDHPPPTLIALGSFSGNSRAIVNAYPARNIKLTIAQNYDVRLSRVRRSATSMSPFYGDEV